MELRVRELAARRKWRDRFQTLSGCRKDSRIEWPRESDRLDVQAASTALFAASVVDHIGDVLDILDASQ